MEDTKLIDGLSLTIGWLCDRLRDRFHVDDSVQIKSFGIDPIGEGNGYMSQLRKITLKWSDEEKLPSSVIVKVANTSAAEKAWESMNISPEESAKTGIELIEWFHVGECNVYEYFASNPPVSMPKYYYFNRDISKKDPLVIVLEDLSQFTVVDLIDGFNNAQLFAIVDALVALHAHIIIRSEKSDDWKSVVSQPNEDAQLEQFVSMISGTAEMIGKLRPDVFDENLRKANEKFFNAKFFRGIEDMLKTGELYPMFVHGDLWSTNMLWNGDQLASIIDWQICRCGTLVEDLQRVLATCVSADVRRRMTDTLLYYYYGQLCKSMALTNRVMPFDWKQLRVAYKWTLGLTAAGTVFAAGMWMSSPVLLRGDNPSARIDEMLQRTKAIVDDALDAFNDDHK